MLILTSGLSSLSKVRKNPRICSFVFFFPKTGANDNNEEAKEALTYACSSETMLLMIGMILLIMSSASKCFTMILKFAAAMFFSSYSESN